VTTRSATRRRILTADRLYTAAVLIGAALIPHLAISIVGDWPPQPFSLHVLLVLLLTGGGWKVEVAEQQAELITGEPSKTKKSKKSKKAVSGYAPSNDMERFEDIVSRLRKEDDDAEA